MIAKICERQITALSMLQELWVDEKSGWYLRECRYVVVKLSLGVLQRRENSYVLIGRRTEEIIPEVACVLMNLSIHLAAHKNKPLTPRVVPLLK